jgi:putative methyltransferase (TIGR04325 family)
MSRLRGWLSSLARARRAAPGVPLARLLRPSWEFVPEGWDREADPYVVGWDVDQVAEVERREWPAFVDGVSGTAPLDYSAPPHDFSHNVLVSFAYALSTAAEAKPSLSLLDWGGGVGHHHVIAKSILPGRQIEYHVRDLEALASCGADLQPDVRFHTDEACLDRAYDLVMASNSLQYSRDWSATLGRLARSAASHLYLSLVPTVFDQPSFVVLQRPYRYGYAAEYLGWFLNRDEVMGAATSAGVELVREFSMGEHERARGAPEQTTQWGYLFRREARPAPVPGQA